MSEMVERIVASQRDDLFVGEGKARNGIRGFYVRSNAIDDAGDYFDPMDGPFSTYKEAENEIKRINARAAIAAMREPSAEMIRAAGYRADNDKDVKAWMDNHDWPLMIDEALRG